VATSVTVAPCAAVIAMAAGADDVCAVPEPPLGWSTVTVLTGAKTAFMLTFPLGIVKVVIDEFALANALDVIPATASQRTKPWPTFGVAVSVTVVPCAAEVGFALADPPPVEAVTVIVFVWGP